MDSIFRLRIRYSTSHLFFPKIVIGILIILAAAIVVRKVIVYVRNKQPIIKTNWKFFAPGTDFFMLFGCLALFILYVWMLKILGFLISSLIFVFLFNLLFCRTREKKSVLVSLVISVVSCVFVWYLFSVVFNISLP